MICLINNKIVLIVFNAFLLTVLSGDCFLNNESIVKDEEILAKFDDFVRKYNKPYRKGSEEYHKRMKIFQESLARHVRLNHQTGNSNAKSTAQYGVNKFSDLLPSEFKDTYLKYTDNPLSRKGTKQQFSARNVLESFRVDVSNDQVPKSIDWRARNAVTAVKNQNQCGACWAYSISENVESMNAIRHGTLDTLSTQQLIDCTPSSNQCNGGSPCSAAEWLVNDKVKLAPLDDYPSIPTYQNCRLERPTDGVSVESCHCTSGNLNETQSLIIPLATNGPVAVAVDAAQWQDYDNGIIKFHCTSDDLNHAVQVVGYDLTGDVPYYIVRNSWGADFGVDGYLYIEAFNNVCGISEDVVSLDVF